MKLENNSTILTEDDKENGWFTDENGNRVHIDPATGQKDAGWGGVHNGETLKEAKESSKTGSHKVADVKDAPVIQSSGNRESFADFWKAHGDLKASAAATLYVRKHYVDGVGKIENPKGLPKNTTVIFTGNNARETGNKINSDKMKALPYLEEIYRQGKYLGSSEVDKGKHPNVKLFHYTGGKIKQGSETYHVTLCAKEMKTQKDIRHYMIDKADKAQDEKLRANPPRLSGIKIRGCGKALENPWESHAFRMRVAQGLKPENSDLENIITNDADGSKQLFEFVDFTVEKATGKKITADDAGSFSLVHLKGTTGKPPLTEDASNYDPAVVRIHGGGSHHPLKNIINNDFEIVHIGFEENPMNKPNQSLQREALSFDASSKRRYDDNGFMHVDGSHITKEQVAPYWGREIPNWQRHGLDPDKMYYGYRPADELEKAVGTFNGLPLLLHHHVESAAAPQKNYRIGSMGTSAVWNPPYIDNALSITDKVGIQAVEDGVCREISSAYQYDPDFTPGTFEGTPYDFVMRNIRGNHVALVEEGRAGPDVVVADAQIQPNLKEKSVMSKLKDFFKGAFDGDLETPAADEDKALAIRKVIGELLPMVPEEKLEALVGTLKDLAYAKDENVVDPTEPVPGDLNAAEADKLGEKDEIRKEEREKIPGGQDDNTAEIIAAGENHERDKLMSEHMDADKAWDACGFDSDDPAIKAAFTKGFAWGMKDGEKNGKRDAERAVAADAQIKARMDAYQKNMDAKYDAAHEVGRHVGDIRVTAFDSADDIYVHGLKEMGVPSGMYSKASARDVFRMAVKMHDKRLAQDNAPAPKFEGKFAGLNDIL